MLQSVLGPGRRPAGPMGQLEQLEALEQLRGLEAGYSIAVGITPEAFPPGTDTEADLVRAEQRFA